MKRDYETGTKEQVTFFTGVEVEKTPAFGMKTLFVTGKQDYNEIIKYYKEEQCEHIFFGAIIVTILLQQMSLKIGI